MLAPLRPGNERQVPWFPKKAPPPLRILIIMIHTQWSWHLITHRLYDKAETVGLETGTQFSSRPRGYATAHPSCHPLVNRPVFPPPASPVHLFTTPVSLTESEGNL